MAQYTSIGWTDHTINFWWGCEKVSDGCKNCYAERDSKRYGNDIWGAYKPRRFIASAVDTARKINAIGEKTGVRQKVFSNSMSDFFETDHGQPIVDHTGERLFSRDWRGPYVTNDSDAEPDRAVTLTDLRTLAFRTIDETPWIDWQVLTKRPANILAMWPDRVTETQAAVFPGMPGPLGQPIRSFLTTAHRRNLWLLISAENQHALETRIVWLLKCRGLVPVLGLSCEPLLGPIKFRIGQLQCFDCETDHSGGTYDRTPEPCLGRCGIDWVITGCESGGKDTRREMDPQWVLDIDLQCRAAGVPHFLKQMYDDEGHLDTDGHIDGQRVQNFPEMSR